MGEEIIDTPFPMFDSATHPIDSTGGVMSTGPATPHGSKTIGEILDEVTTLPDTLTAKALFNAGDIVTHRLTEKKIMIVEAYWEKEVEPNRWIYAGRDENYMMYNFNEFELK